MLVIRDQNCKYKHQQQPLVVRKDIANAHTGKRTEKKSINLGVTMAVRAAASQQEGCGFSLRLGVFLHVLPVFVWVLCRFSCLLPHSKKIRVR